MQLGLNLGYWSTGLVRDTTLVTEAERLGYDSVWTAEAYGSDAATPLAYLAARTERIRLGSGILQMPARTPAMTAMTAATLDEMSNGRFLLGLGVSGPQVVEGWHGQPYGKPLLVTREYVEIVRMILAREGPVEYDGVYYQMPYQGPGTTGAGKALKLISKPLNSNLPIYLAAIGPRNVRLTAEIADGWLPVFYSPEHARTIFQPLLDEGFSRSGEEDKADRFDTAVSVFVSLDDDLERARLAAKPMISLYVGGMGAKGKNFYHDLAHRYGYGEAADRIQESYLAGRKMEAMRAVPDELVDEVSLVGSRERIADRLEAWKESGVSTLIAATTDLAAVRALAELIV
ncbi:MAG: LLM class F420-dependent oxidoreductase [Actinomycetota bacterium]|nr:LLM class F420-dependent oxidoreductase [Actinomycetota bacterium]